MNALKKEIFLQYQFSHQAYSSTEYLITINFDEAKKNIRDNYEIPIFFSSIEELPPWELTEAIINKELVNLVEQEFLMSLKNFSLYQIIDFLDYHYIRYSNKKTKFLSFLRDLKWRFYNHHYQFLEVRYLDLDSDLKNDYYDQVFDEITRWYERKEKEPFPGVYNDFTESFEVGQVEHESASSTSIQNHNHSNFEPTTKQQILIMHYLGLLDNNLRLSQNKLGEFLAVLFRKGNDGVKDALLNNKVKSKTAKNLEYVRELFEKFDLETSRIVADIDKLREEKKKRG